MKGDYLADIRSRAKEWLSEEFDSETRAEVRNMLEHDEKKLVDSFYRDMEFGTGGLRGIMGAGTNRMNRYTLGMATQGLSNYIKKSFGDKEISVAIAHDCRHNSRLYAEITADIFAANGFTVLLFESLRPTPELSYAIRKYGCRSGVIITASHNPPEYNGYKAYWEDGGQVTAPHDENIIEEVRKITSVSMIKTGGDPGLIKPLGKETDDAFIEEVAKISLNPELIKKHHDIGIVFTPIHGTAVHLVPAALRRFGFTNIINVPEQDVIDGNFPTVDSPNPEEKGALAMAIKRAVETGAEIVAATDPDGDRLGVAVRNLNNEFILLNGNQTGVLLLWYIIDQKRKKNLLKGNEFVIKTIVTTGLFETIAVENGVKCYNVLTGFKHFASLIRELEGKEKYIGGGEESYGFLPDDYVRDKDAVGSIALFGEIAAYAASKGKTVYQLLIDIYVTYGLFRERLVNIVRKGKDGADEINSMMQQFRDSPPAEINGSPVVRINDYATLTSRDITTGKTEKLDILSSNVLQFFLGDGSIISVRPSGTEPKIKFYFSVRSRLKSPQEFAAGEAALESRLDNIIRDMKLE
ncbi:MAG: phospho-sugar mutase [Bacteroidales bacterium]